MKISMKGFFKGKKTVYYFIEFQNKQLCAKNKLIKSLVMLEKMFKILIICDKERTKLDFQTNSY